MASAFWGGFADTMRGDMDKNDAAKRELETYGKKKEIDMDFETTDVEDVNQAGKPVIRKINGKGKVVSERLLTQTEQEARQLAKRKIIADIDSAEGNAVVNKNQARDYDADRQHKLDQDAATSRRADESISIQRAGQRSLEADRVERRADKAEDRKIRLQDKAEKDAETNASALAGEVRQKVAEQLSSLGADVPTRNRARVNIYARIAEIEQSGKSEPQKKLALRKLYSVFTSNASLTAAQKAEFSSTK